MGNNTKKKVRSLPPLGKESRSKSKKRHEGLEVQMPDRQRLIGSPAPQSMRRISEKHQKSFKKSGSVSEFPTITLSACEDDSDDDEDEDNEHVQRDSVIEVGQVGGGLRSRTNSASNLSMASIGSLVETYRSMSARSGLTPPPRFLSMKNDQGNQVVSELTQLEKGDTEDNDKAPDTASSAHSGHGHGHHKARSGRHRRNSNLPSLSPSRSGSSNGHIPSKYSPLDPIKTGSGHETRHKHRHIGRRRRSSS